MTRAAVGGGVTEPHALNAAAVVGGEFLAFDLHRQLRAFVLLAQQFGAQTYFGAETFARTRQFGQLGQRLCGTKVERDAAGFLLRQDARFVHLHRRPDGSAERNGVNALFVADEVGKRQCIQIIDAGSGAERPGGFVFQAARRDMVFGPLDDREMGPVDGRNTPTGYSTGKTGRIGDQIGFAVAFPRYRHGFGGNVASAIELAIPVIVGRQRAGFVDHVHQHLGAHGRQPLAGDGVFG